MKKENLAIISNEKTQFDGKNYFCDNIDMKSIPEGLSKDFEIELFVRKSKLLRTSHKINLNNIVISSGIIAYILKVLKTINLNKKYLIISLSPYSFIICLLLFLLRKKVFVYLRSDGYQEYKYYSKYFGPIIYHFMFTLVSWKSELIACRSHLLKGKKGEIVSPSQINENWFDNRKSPDLSKIKLLYVGRIRVEKGIFSLLQILKKVKLDFTITIINPEKFYDKKLENEKVNVVHFEKNHESIMEIYDQHNIFVLPSYTEGHPQVLDESLSRLRPVIIFPEISYVKRNKEGVLVAERNSESLSNKINFIMNNYKNIQEKITNNKFPTKKLFLNEMTKIIMEKKYE
tara:strand:- start:131 stop:1165 length:1035 start_codon:yes stop_codon:yes gene_type:complete